MLTDVRVRSAKAGERDYKIFDGGGLFLLVRSNGSKLWRIKYRLGKEKTFSVGQYPAVSLGAARKERQRVKELIGEGKDPNEKKREDGLARVGVRDNSFERVAREWMDWRKDGLTDRYWSTVLYRLEAYVFAEIGRRPISELEPVELLEVFRKIEQDDHLDLLRKLVQTCSGIFRYAVVHRYAERDITTDLRGAFKTAKVRNHARLVEDELPEFFAKLRAYGGDMTTKNAFDVLIHTFVRSVELRCARWDELKFDKGEWHIPASRMKMGRLHVVPLSGQAEAAFLEQREISGDCEFVFPNDSGKQPIISENRLLYALYSMGYKGRATVHGFRGTASTILNEHEFNRDWIEMQLAHAHSGSVRMAYNHAQYLGQRRRMMQWYSDHLDGLKARGLSEPACHP